MKTRNLLPDDVEIREMTIDDFRKIFRSKRSEIFDKAFEFRSDDILSETEKEATIKLANNMGQPFYYCLMAFHKNEVIGWSFGKQIDAEKYYMINSAVYPAYRRQGIYAAMVQRVIEKVSAEGFQVIFSRHVATNSAVIAAKLQQGFVITSMELTDTFGLLVHLSFYTNPIRRRVLGIRAGEVFPDQEMLKLMGI